MDIAITASPPQVRARPQSLQSTLSALHVPVLDRNVVREHRKQTVWQSRFGIYKILGPVLYLINKAFFLIAFGSTRRPLRFDDPISSFIETGSSALLRLLATVIGSAALLVGLWLLSTQASGPIALSAAFLFWTTLACAVVMVFYFFFMPTVDAFFYFSGLGWFELRNAQAIWERRLITSASAKALSEQFGIPERLHGRIQRLSALPEAEVHVESFETDPLLVVTRTHGPFGLFTQTAYIGGWDTGKPGIDNV